MHQPPQHFAEKTVAETREDGNSNHAARH
ncbi:hypothetical protein O2313_11695 [Bacillus amyloliquefaciens]|nr:hypothetical protein [Bacillus amyloliquefaciens]MCZ4248185.1 hypothetical protein [Bacillus amyloliquefaciens]